MAKRACISHLADLVSLSERIVLVFHVGRSVRIGLSVVVVSIFLISCTMMQTLMLPLLQWQRRPVGTAADREHVDRSCQRPDHRSDKVLTLYALLSVCISLAYAKAALSTRLSFMLFLGRLQFDPLTTTTDTSKQLSANGEHCAGTTK